ncbi:NleD-like pathogen effector protein (putative zinc metallopeptidase) [Paraburkholderia sp. BL8N3]|nr:M91 family zinc metallopeptidase [Paraburkholderia sp. BL8N3]TCK35255.1 NleD-like pathogen effector protein (putative zinc metallopeptidase) [Paraburkholderia sp. BL8N3]
MPSIGIPRFLQNPSQANAQPGFQWTPTQFSGVMVGRRQLDPASFVGATLEALDKIAGGVAGRRLMDQIELAAALIHTTLPYKIAIIPSGDGQRLSLSPGSFGARVYAGSNSASASNLVRAQGAQQVGRTSAPVPLTGNVSNFNAAAWASAQMRFLDGDIGSPSMIRWNPSKYDSPDGHRPPFIGLAHELIHAMRSLKGETAVYAEADELAVTGLRPYPAGPITENAIRADHGIAPRSRYSGLQPGALTT